MMIWLGWLIGLCIFIMMASLCLFVFVIVIDCQDKMKGWQKGEQSGGYEFLKIFKVFSYEINLVRVREGQEISIHVNNCGLFEELRKLIFVLKKAQKGGTFICNLAFFNLGRLIYLSPSRMMHKVERVDKGETLMLFFGWKRRKK